MRPLTIVFCLCAALAPLLRAEEAPAPPSGAAEALTPAASAPAEAAPAVVEGGTPPPEIVPAGPAEELAEPEGEGDATEDFEAAPKRSGFPWSDTLLGGVGGGLLGCTLGFFGSGDANGLNYEQLHSNLPLYGGIGLGAGLVIGYLLGATDPFNLAPPEPLKKQAAAPAWGLSAAWLPGGGHVGLTARF
jgi:hypothetical protein